MSQAVTRSALLLAVLAAGCNDSSSPTTLTSGDKPDAQYASMGTNPPGQVAHIEGIVKAIEDSWAAADAAAFAASYSADVQFISPTGGVISGRHIVQAGHVGAFSQYFPASTLEIEVRRIEFLTGTIAMVDLNYRVSNFQALPGGLQPTEPGVIRHVVRWILVKQRGEWLIHGQQMTPVPPPPQQP